MDQLVTFLNASGRWFCQYAGAMFVQTGILIAALLFVDLFIHKRVRAALRYWMWMLVFVKLLLPPTLALPTGIGYWRGQDIPAVAPGMEEPLPARTLDAPAHESVAAVPEMAVDVSPVSVSDASRPVDVPASITLDRGPTPTWQAVVFVVWLVGLLVFGLLLVQRASFVRGLVAQSVPADGSLLEKLEQCAQQIGASREIELRISPNTFSPAVCGLVHPVILLPATLLEKLSGENLRVVLIHELAHIKRGDLWVNLAQTVLQVLYFYNPLVWLAHAIVRRVREQAVDEMALVALGAEAKSYSRTLIDMAEMAFFRANLALRLIGVAESKKSLEGRIKHMLTRPTPKTARMGAKGLSCILAIGAVLLPMARAQRQNTLVRASQDARERTIATLPNGLTMELVGLCQDPAAKGQQWWHPDGTLMADPGLDLVRGRDPRYPAFGYFFKFSTVEDVTHTTGPLGQSLSYSWSSGGGGQAVYGFGNSQHPVSPLPDQTDIAVDVAAGAWHVYELRSDSSALSVGPVSIPLSDDVTLVLSGLRPDPRREMSHALIEATTTSDDLEVRLECTTHDGRNLRGGVTQTQTDAGRLVQQTFGFAAPVEQIEKIVVKHRAIHHLVFRNVSLRPGHRTTVIVEELPDAAQPADGVPSGRRSSTVRLESARRLSGLGKVLLLHANRHDDRFPANLTTDLDWAEMHPSFSSWLRDNVVYLGKSVTTADRPDRPIAYDKTLLADGGGTNVLYLDSHVAFETPERLAEIGITSAPERFRSARQLADLGKALLIYANDHDDTFPYTLGDLRPDVDQDTLQWLREHVDYFGKGMNPKDNPARVLAYDKTMMDQGGGTNVLYLDSHVAFESPERLKEIEEVWFSRPSLEDQAESRARLLDLGKALLFYANDHDDRLPDDLSDIREYNRVGYAWLLNNVAYVGKGVTAMDRPDRPVAYDKTLIESGSGTNVLYLDSHVAYEHVDQLERFGIKRDPDSPVVMRPVSARRLANLGKALLVYMVDHGKYPDSLDQMTSYLGSDDLAWLENSAAYLGKGKTETMRPDTVMAYDKTLLEGDLGTNVLYLDCHVAFETPERLDKLGIRSKMAERALVVNRMRRLALAAIMYAHEHEGRFADDLEALKPYAGGEEEFAWMLANAKYLGKGVTVQVRNPAQRPLAYSVASDGAAIAFFDGHVEFVPHDRLKGLGIELAP